MKFINRKGRFSLVANLMVLFLGFCFLGTGFAHSAVHSTTHFESLTIDHGLPDNTVRSLLQDRNGFLWFGTAKGLVRYDGHNMVPLSSLISNPESLTVASVKQLHEDGSGRIWIAFHASGLGMVDPSDGSFRHFVPLDSDETTLSSLRLTDVCSDHHGNIWVGTVSAGFCRYDFAEDRFYRYADQPDSTMDFPGLNVSCVAVDNQNHLWVGFDPGGLLRIDSESGVTQLFSHVADDERSLPHDKVRDIFVTPNGQIWVSTDSGLALWKEESKSFKCWKPDLSDPHSRSNHLIKIAQDSMGQIWVGSEIGLLVFNPETEKFKKFTKGPESPDFPTGGVVISPLCDASGIIWAGTWLSGVVKYDPDAQHFANFGQKNVESLVFDQNETLWVGFGEGRETGKSVLGRKSREKKEFQYIGFPDPRVYEVTAIVVKENHNLVLGTNTGLWEVSSSPGPQTPIHLDIEDFPQSRIQTLMLDSHHDLWVGFARDGLVRLDLESGQFIQFQSDICDSTNLSSNIVISLHEDTLGRIWVGTDGGGLNLFNPKTESFEVFREGNNYQKSISHIMDGHRGRLWLATYGGLLEFSPEQGVLRILDRSSGLPDDVVGSPQWDSQGKIWFSTGRGLIRFNPETEEFKVFTTANGLPDNSLCNAHEKGINGRLFFGGKKALYSFLPEEFGSRTIFSPLVLTGVEVSGSNQFQFEKQNQLANATSLQELQLTHDQNDLEFSFATLDFSRPEAIRYRYRLENYDQDWRSAGRDRKAVYTNLSPGKYTLRVLSTNREGVWRTLERVVVIVISPPWWKTQWAYLIYLTLGLLAAWSIYRQVVGRERFRSALELKDMEARQLQELNTMRSRFFTNISHEFRTPLTLIKGPLKTIKTNPEGFSEQSIELMTRNANRLHELIDQLLDLSRLESRRMPIKRMYGDCSRFLRALAASFVPYSEEQRISFENSFPETPCDGWFDPDLMEKVVGNLLMNAFKFTPPHGTVKLEIQYHGQRTIKVPEEAVQSSEIKHLKQNFLKISVSNSGSFISEDDQKQIFSRFYQVVTQKDSGEVGSGIGLALVHDLVDLLDGTIEVESIKAKETTFTVELPVLLDEPENAVTGLDMQYDVAPVDMERVSGSLEKQELADDADTLIENEQEMLASDLPLLLIVEDHSDLRMFLHDQLEGQYRLLQAEDGDAGLAMAFAETPDLVISDVMMPGLGGFELCDRLKKDRRTNHIPIILLTARTEQESRMEGYTAGADAYLAKPFDPEELKIRITNLIDMRSKLREVFASQVVILDPAAMPEENDDERFLKELQTIITENMTDSDFNVVALAREMGMSRMNLHRKMKALTGQTCSSLLKNSRLNRAAKLLDSGSSNVTEAAYAAGFNTLGHFSANFKELYKMTPSEYRDRKNR